MTNQQGAPEALRLADEFDWWLARGITIEPRLYDAATELRRLHAENARLAALVGTQQPAPSAAAAITDTEAFQNFHRLLCARFGYVHDESDWRRDQLSLVEHIARQAQPSPAPQADSQPAPVLDMAVMQLAESVGLIGPASRVHDLHAAIQRFHDLICVNATIKAAVMAADAIRGAATSARDYPPLPMQFACTGVFPVYSADQMRAYVDADRESRAPADSVTAPAAGAVAGPSEAPEGWRNQFAEAVYADLEAADNQDVPLEEYPARILKVLDSIVGPRHPTVIHWRNDAIQACIAIAYKYCRDPESFQYLKQDLQALIFAARAPADSVTAPAGGVDDDVDAVALARYKVVPAHESMFHRFAVVAGDGKQQLYLGREIECANMARKFAGAFLDGVFYQSNIAPAQTAPSVLEDVARLTTEQEYAIRQGHEIAASEAYFGARPKLDTNRNHNIFTAGFERGWDAARKQGGA